MVKRVSVKVKDYERLDDENVKHVIGLLEQDAPITKKAACGVLSISYNTKRLDNIIQTYKDKLVMRKTRFAKNRGTAWDNFDTKLLVIRYLKGDSISGLSDSLFRSNGAIKKQLEFCGVPFRSTDASYHRPDILPDSCLKESFKNGELVWSSRYCCVVEVGKLFQVHKDHGNVYDIWIYGKHNQSGYQPWYELGELPILSNIGASKNDFKLDIYGEY